jgi:transcriptional regulator with PAS, ATPase and Fis domain
MRVIDNDSREFCATVAHYIGVLVERRDYLGAVGQYEQHKELLESTGGSESGAALHQAAKAYASLSNYPMSLRVARRAQAMASSGGDNLLLADIFVTLGETLRNMGEYREAEKALRDAESIFRRNDCPEGQSRALNQLAGLFFRRNDYKNALAVLMDAVEITRRLGDKKKIAYMMGNIGRIFTFLGEFDNAEHHLKINIELSEELSDETETGRAYLSLGYLYIQQAEYAIAEQTLQKAYPHIVAANDVRDEVIYLTYVGELQYKSGRYDEARATLTEALGMAEKIQRDGTMAGRIMRHLAELYVREGNHRVAARFVSKAMAIFEKVSDLVETGALYKLKSIVAEASGQNTEGRLFMMKAIELLADSGVRWEKAEALVAAGNSKLFNLRERVTYLFRAEEFYTRSRVGRMADEVARMIDELEHVSGASQADGAKASAASATVDYVTACPEIVQFKARLPMFGRSDLPVLLTGETGVGKDHLARYFHSVVCPNGPYVAINCASLPETLLESELFGYRRGAFTGADNNKLGLFVAANGGVLLLDEIGDMPLSLQAKLLGVLESRKVTPLGGVTPVEFNVKLLAATNKNLEEMVEAGTFRRDLYYRLSGITFRIPPLRDRKGDIPLLLTHFMVKRSLLRSDEKVETELLKQFLSYDWPGNIRELDNSVKRLEVLAGMVAEGNLVELARSIFERDTPAVRGTLFDRVEEFERRLIVEALLAANGNKCEAARLLGVHEATVRMKLKRYGLGHPVGAPN